MTSMHPSLQRSERVLSDFQINLSAGRIPSPSETDESAKTAIKIAISSLTIIIVKIRRDPNFISKHIAVFRQAWQGVWAWLQFLSAECITEHHGQTIMLHSLRIIPFVIAAFSRDNEAGLRSLIAHTPGVFQILIPHWLRENIDINQDLAKITLDFNFSAALGGLLQKEDHRNAEILTTIVGSASGRAQEIARVAIGHLQSVVFRSPPDFAQITQHLVLVSAFSTSLCPPLRSAMLQNRSLPVIIDTVKAMGTQAVPAGFVTLSYLALSDALDSANGPVWIIQSLDVGLLSAILKAGFQLTQPGVPSSVCAMIPKWLFKLLHQYMVYRSVLRSLSKAITKTEQEGIDIPTSGLFWGEWEMFRAAAKNRLVEKDDFDAMNTLGAEPGFYGCQAHCGAGSEGEVRRCTGCLDALYCSEQCQRNDWPRHKMSCKAWQNSIQDSLNIPLSKHDRDFLHFIAHRDFQQQQGFVNVTVQTQYPSTPITSLLVQMDYLLVPMQLEVVPISSSEWVDDDTKLELDGLIRRARQHGNRTFVLMVRVRQGHCHLDGLVQIKSARIFPLLATEASH